MILWQSQHTGSGYRSGEFRRATDIFGDAAATAFSTGIAHIANASTPLISHDLGALISPRADSGKAVLHRALQSGAEDNLRTILLEAVPR